MIFDLFEVVYQFVCLFYYIPYRTIYYICRIEYYHVFLLMSDNISYKEIEPHIKTVSKIYFWTRERRINELSRSKKEVGRRKREKKRK